MTDKSKNCLYSLPAALALGIIPLIVRMKAYSIDYGDQEWWFSDGAVQASDFFLYYKAAVVIFTAAVMVIILFLRAFSQYKIHKLSSVLRSEYKIFIPLAVYFISVLISGLFSAHPHDAFFGIGDLFEGIFVIFAYCIFCIYSYTFVRNEKSLKLTLAAGAAGAFIAALIAFFQFLNMDPFKTDTVKKLIIPVKFWDKLDEVRFAFTEHMSYGTFYNSNYMTQYFGFCLTIALCVLFFANVSKRVRIFCGCLSALAFLSLAGGYSKTGIVSLAVVLIFGVCFQAAVRKKNGRKILIGGLVLFVFAISFFILRFEGIGSIIKRFTTDTAYSGDMVTNMITGDKDAALAARDGSELHLCYDIDEETGLADIILSDENGEELPYIINSEGDAYELTEGTFKGSVINAVQTDTDRGSVVALSVLCDGVKWIFSKQEDGYYYLNPAGKLVKIGNIDKAEIFPDSLFSGRGNIWNKTLPILKSCIIKGCGANTFVYAYPQTDYVSKAYEINPMIIDVKPHSLYLQQFAENGFIAFAAFLFFVIFYLYKAVKHYKRISLNDLPSAAGFGIFLGIIWYLISGITNDSNVNTAPVFWLMLGIGYYMVGPVDPGS